MNFKPSLLPFITVIVPHKNNSKKLIRLLASIPDDNDIEILVVDDKSNRENYESILKVFKPNLKVVVNSTSQSNAGVARNTGISIAKGKWILFADSDDCFSDNAFSLFKSALNERDNMDVVLFNCYAKKEGGEDSTRADVVQFLMRQFPNNYDNVLYYWVVPWGKAIKRSIIDENGLFFDSCVAANDVMFSTRLAGVSKNIDAIDEYVYCCYESPHSITATLTEEKAISRLSVMIDRNSYMIMNDIDCRLGFGAKFFIKSKPWRLNAEKMNVYFSWARQLFLYSITYVVVKSKVFLKK